MKYVLADAGSVCERQSHPTGVRGLKSAVPAMPRDADNVAPHWGAWIEIA